MNRAVKWKLVLAFVAVFAAGAVTGSLGVAHFAARWFFHPPRPADMAARMRNHLRAELALTPAQVEKISPIINRAVAELEAVHTEGARRVGQVMSGAHAAIAAELSPEQRKKLDAIERRRHETLRRHGFGPPPP